MEIKKIASAGTMESSDVYVEIEPGNGQLEICLAGTNPSSDVRELQIQFHTLFHGLPILGTVNEELGLANDAVGRCH